MTEESDMLCELFNRRGLKKLLSFEATTVCQVDFCDQCGDCLDCHWEDGCAGKAGVEHRWVLYADDVEAFLKVHELSEKIVEEIRAAVKEG